MKYFDDPILDSWCVEERMTKNVADPQRYTTTKNSRELLKSTYASYRMKKSRFVSVNTPLIGAGIDVYKTIVCMLCTTTLPMG